MLCEGQMVMVIGLIESYSPYDGGKGVLRSSEDKNLFVHLDLTGCDISSIVEHAFFRVIGRFYTKEENKVIKVQSIRAVPSWKYHTFLQIIKEQRSFKSAENNDQ